MTNREGFSQNAIRILKARYYMKDDKGGFLDKTPADLTGIFCPTAPRLQELGAACV